ncbi:MAG: acetate kinase [Rhodocyclaceae bacterium]|nr:acetate kinase [Rhodocyclaceae bacterium]
MQDGILTLNAGSSSLKFALFPYAPTLPERPGLFGAIDGLGSQPRFQVKDAGGTLLDTTIDLPSEGAHRAALAHLFAWLASHEGGWSIQAVGHRVVHGGEHFTAPVCIDEAVMAQLAQLIPLAPLHQPHNLAGIEAMRSALPHVPQIACFDTAFHRSQPALAQLFALPRKITALGVRRYGFHGLSYEYIAEALPRHLPCEKADGRVIVAHLGNGASMCALWQRKSIATTMGFTALEGLMMGTRCGALDPGVLLYLLEHQGMSVAALTQLLYKESGLLGVSGISSDMRTLLASDHPEAQEAIELFCYRIVRETGSLVAALGGLDVFVFTGGIGEHAAPIRARVCRQLAWLGLALDEAANAAGARCISSCESRIPVLVLPTNEEWIIARHVLKLLKT